MHFLYNKFIIREMAEEGRISELIVFRNATSFLSTNNYQRCIGSVITPRSCHDDDVDDDRDINMILDRPGRRTRSECQKSA